MQLPDFLREAIEEKTSKLKPSELAQFSQKLSERYRSHKKVHSAFMQGAGDHLAYLTTRFPATYAAIVHVLNAVRERIPHLEINDFLDVGAGPGTGYWAVNEIFENMPRATLIERDPGLISLGKSFQKHTSNIKWVQKNLEHRDTFENHDLILMSYVLGELPEVVWGPLIENLWRAATKIIIFIEPGTPAGFKRIHQIREKLLSLGAHIAAPCPHAGKCPMTGTDWCHFSQRVERSSRHRHAKGADLGYEDEKFSYIAAVKEPLVSSDPRIVRHPAKRPGHVELTLCTDTGIQTKIISRKQKETYHKARKSEWGSLLNLNAPIVE